jgi:hypothetical protein
MSLEFKGCLMRLITWYEVLKKLEIIGLPDSVCCQAGVRQICGPIAKRQHGVLKKLKQHRVL